VKTNALAAFVAVSSRVSAVSVRRAPANEAVAKAAVTPANKPRSTRDRHRRRMSARDHISGAAQEPMATGYYGTGLQESVRASPGWGVLAPPSAYGKQGVANGTWA
jgi:hypothetical protein